MKSYVTKILQPDEQIIVTGRLHWITYLSPFFIFVAATGLLVLAQWISPAGEFLTIAVLALYAIAALSFLYRWFIRWITELTVTNKRVVYGQSFIFRRTVEMHMDKVESVRVDQSVLGRLLDYGTIHVLGTGQGIEHLHRMGSPLTIRNAITAT